MSQINQDTATGAEGDVSQDRHEDRNQEHNQNHIESQPVDSAEFSDDALVPAESAASDTSNNPLFDAEPIATGDARVDAAVARLAESNTQDDDAAIAVLSDVHDRLHSVLVTP